MNYANENAVLLYIASRERQGGLPENNSRDVLVTNILRRFGLPANLNGYWYIRTAILFAAEDPELLHLMTKSLYPIVAQVHKTTASRVDRCIRHALDRCWNCADGDTVNAFFGCTLRNDKCRPSGGEFISVIADSICLIEKSCGRKHAV